MTAIIKRRNSYEGQGPKKTFTGSCACRKVTYTIDLCLPEQPFALRCNCTFCTKEGFDKIEINDKSQFKLQTPCTSEEAFGSKHGQYLGVYITKNEPGMKRFFCDVCGSSIMKQGTIESEGQTYELFGINLKTIDQPQEGLDFSKFGFQYLNALKDDHENARMDGPFPNGLR